MYFRIYNIKKEKQYYVFEWDMSCTLPKIWLPIRHYTDMHHLDVHLSVCASETDRKKWMIQYDFISPYNFWNSCVSSQNNSLLIIPRHNMSDEKWLVFNSRDEGCLSLREYIKEISNYTSEQQQKKIFTLKNTKGHDKIFTMNTSNTKHLF